jgi:hypothetical protein
MPQLWLTFEEIADPFYCDTAGAPPSDCKPMGAAEIQRRPDPSLPASRRTEIRTPAPDHPISLSLAPCFGRSAVGASTATAPAISLPLHRHHAVSSRSPALGGVRALAKACELHNSAQHVATLLRGRLHSLDFDYSPRVGRAEKIEESLRGLGILCPRHQKSMDDSRRHDA